MRWLLLFFLSAYCLWLFRSPLPFVGEEQMRMVNDAKINALLAVVGSGPRGIARSDLVDSISRWSPTPSSEIEALVDQGCFSYSGGIYRINPEGPFFEMKSQARIRLVTANGVTIREAVAQLPVSSTIPKSSVDDACSDPKKALPNVLLVDTRLFVRGGGSSISASVSCRDFNDIHAYVDRIKKDCGDFIKEAFISCVGLSVIDSVV